MMLLKLFLSLLVIYLCIVIYMTVMQRQLMYYPSKQMLSPSAYGLDFLREYKIPSEDGTQITYWYAQAAGDKPTIAYFHGNGGNLSHRAYLLQLMHDAGYGILALSYRGYGNSEGTPNEKGIYQDARAVLKALRETHHVAESETILHGESLGTGIAIEMARGKKFKAMTLQSPYTSTLSRAKEIYWWLPVSLVMFDRFESINKIKEITTPTLITAGDADTLIPLHDSQKLFDAISAPKHMIVYPYVGHNDFQAEMIVKAISDFDHNQR